MSECSHYSICRHTHQVGTVRVELTTVVTVLDVDLGLVNEADDLDVGGGAHELDTGEGTLGDEAGATAGLGAPSDLLTLRVGDERVLLGGSPEAEVWACDLVGVKASICNFLTIKAV